MRSNNLKMTADDATWTVREAAWNLREAAWKIQERVLWRVQERFVWRGADALRERLDRIEALERGHAALAPVQRRFETRIAWPLADAFRARGRTARAATAAALAAAAVAAGTGGAILAHDEASPADPRAVAVASRPLPAAIEVSEQRALKGVAPDFEVVRTAAAADAPAVKVPAAAPASAEPPAKVAWRFAEAFVQYEIGRSSEREADGFAATAAPALVKALREDPPRLPTDAKVPRARVLNVVLADPTQKGSEVVASVSLLRLRAVSEVRLTLRRDDRGWRVAEVLG